MTVYGITRASTRKQQASPEVQAEMIRKHCATVQLPEPTILDESLDTSGQTTDFRLHANPVRHYCCTGCERRQGAGAWR